MQTYNKAKPLIVIHMPKAAGTSTREIFKLWFEGNFHNHYYNESKGTMPPKMDLPEKFLQCWSEVNLNQQPEILTA